MRALSVLFKFDYVTTGFVNYSTEVNEGLKEAIGGFEPILDSVDNAEVGFSLSCLLR